MLKTKMIALALSSVSSTAQVRPPVPGSGTAGSAGGAVYGIIGCAALIIFAGANAYQNQQRELTTEEALSCGLLYFLDPDKPVKKRRR